MENHVDFELSGYRWTVRSDYEQIFRDKIIPLILSEEASPALQVIKHKTARSTFIATLDKSPTGIFVKVHGYDRAVDRIKTVFRPSRARAEWDAGLQMRSAGLPVPESLGVGEKRSLGLVTGCVLFQREIPDVIRLNRFLRTLGGGPSASSDDGPESSSPASDARDETLSSLGGVIRRMHDEGFRHPDLHTGNVLVDAGSSNPNLWLVDLHSVERYSSLAPSVRRADLAKLVFSLRPFLSPSRLGRILAGYAPEQTQAETDRTLSTLLSAADRLRKRRVKSRARRCLKTSGAFVVERIGKMKLYRWRKHGDEFILKVVRRHKEICASRGPELIKFSRSNALTSFPFEGASGPKVYVKEFANKGVIRFFETWFYVHRGRRTWKAGNMLRLLGVPCAEMMALVEEKKFGFPHTSYLIMKEIPDATRLNVFLLRKYFRVSGRLTPEEVDQKRRLILAGAEALTSFHLKNIYHKDLSAKNLLVTIKADGTPRFHCVDTDSIQFPWRLSLRRRIKNLAQLNGLSACVTTADRVRFYKAYFGLARLSMTHKMILRVVRRLSRRRMEHSRRIDARLRKKVPLEPQAFEDIASL